MLIFKMECFLTLELTDFINLTYSGLSNLHSDMNITFHVKVLDNLSLQSWYNLWSHYDDWLVFSGIQSKWYANLIFLIIANLMNIYFYELSFEI